MYERLLIGSIGNVFQNPCLGQIRQKGLYQFPPKNNCNHLTIFNHLQLMNSMFRYFIKIKDNTEDQNISTTTTRTSTKFFVGENKSHPEKSWGLTYKLEQSIPPWKFCVHGVWEAYSFCQLPNIGGQVLLCTVFLGVIG